MDNQRPPEDPNGNRDGPHKPAAGAQRQAAAQVQEVFGDATVGGSLSVLL